jgi:hypothetical protein
MDIKVSTKCLSIYFTDKVSIGIGAGQEFICIFFVIGNSKISTVAVISKGCFNAVA